MKAVAIIPARGGWKRVFEKSIKRFQARPMIAQAEGTALDLTCLIYATEPVSASRKRVQDVDTPEGWAGTEIMARLPPQEII